MSDHERAEAQCHRDPGEGRFVPHITPFKGQKPVPMRNLVPRPDGRGVAYQDEVSEDRDRNGVLWMRLTPPDEGRPIPLFRRIHPRRTAEAALDLRCQGCAGEPDRNRQGILFFARPDPRRRNLNWPETEYTHHPPVCLPCVQVALRTCSFVRRAPALRVRNPRPWGVDGVTFTADGNGHLSVLREEHRCSYDDLKPLPWTLALQPIIQLRRCRHPRGARRRPR